MPSLGSVKRKRPMIITNALDLAPFRDTAEDFLERFRDKPHTFRAYRSDLRRLDDFLSEREASPKAGPVVGDFNRENIDLFIRRCASEVAPTTLQRRLHCFRSLDQHLSVKFYLPPRLKDVRGVYKPQRNKIKALNEDQLKALVSVLVDAPLQHQLMVFLMLYCGLRVSEVQNLRLGNLSPDLSHLNSILGKGGRTRPVPLPVPLELRELLQDYLLRRTKRLNAPEYPLFISHRRSKQRKFDSYRFNVKTVFKVVERYTTEAGISEDLRHPHALRHTFAVRALRHLGKTFDAPRALNVLRQLLGHASVTTTQVYLTHSETELRKSMEDFKC